MQNFSIKYRTYSLPPSRRRADAGAVPAPGGVSSPQPPQNHHPSDMAARQWEPLNAPRGFGPCSPEFRRGSDQSTWGEIYEVRVVRVQAACDPRGCESTRRTRRRWPPEIIRLARALLAPTRRSCRPPSAVAEPASPPHCRSCWPGRVRFSAAGSQSASPPRARRGAQSGVSLAGGPLRPKRPGPAGHGSPRHVTSAPCGARRPGRSRRAS